MIVEDDPDIREGLKLIADQTRGIKLIGTCDNAEVAITTAAKEKPNVILLDIELPGMNGIEAIPYFKNVSENSDILILTVHQDDQTVFNALCAGASGYLIKTAHPNKIMDAVKEINSGGVPMSASIARLVIQSFQKKENSVLTARETDVLRFLCKGHSYKMIADTMHVSWETVHSHIKSIYRKLNVNSKSEAVITALTQKMV